MQVGDWVLVALQSHRVGRLGQVTGNAIQVYKWNPLVQPSRDYSCGEMGRRIFVRWDMTVGLDSRELVVKLPERLGSLPARSVER
jgi:hypothetical protein